MAVGLVTLVVMAPVAPAAMLATWWWQASARRRRLRHRQLLLVRHLPEVVDLLVLAVGAGLTVHASVRAVAERAHGPPAEELATVVEQVRLGRRLAEALEEVPIRAGEALRPLMSALIASERYGAPLGENLARLAEDVRADRRRNAEEMARKVPVKLLFPLVFCTLPAFGLLTVAPLIAGALEGLRP